MHEVTIEICVAVPTGAKFEPLLNTEMFFLTGNRFENQMKITYK